jgi:hypothetical protein
MAKSSPRKHRLIQATIHESSVYALDGDVDTAIELLSAFRKTYPTDKLTISMDVYESYGSPEARMTVYRERLETDEERDTRVALEESREKAQVDRERMQYEALKAKFEK